MKKVTALIIFVFSVLGCGEGSFNSQQIVKKGQHILLQPGDSINKNSEKTRVIIRHTLKSGEKELEVISGSILLVKGNY